MACSKTFVYKRRIRKKARFKRRGRQRSWWKKEKKYLTPIEEREPHLL